MFSELRLIVDPNGTYAALAARPMTLGPLRALRRPFLAAVVLGTAMALSSTRHVTPALVLSTTALWSVVVIGQASIALAVLAFVQAKTASRVSRARAFDLFFASHAPWSLWILFAAAWVPSPLGRPAMPLWLAAVAPLALTPRIIAAFFREVLKIEPRRAAVYTLVHQALTWSLLVISYDAAVAIWPRILEMMS